ncbi:MAG: hypothetical protein U0793_07805 [Gemmataceae bacterium]
MSLEVDEVAAARGVGAAEEVVEADLIEGGERGIGGNVAADAVGFEVRLDHHGHGIPAEDAFDAAFEAAIAVEVSLAFGGMEGCKGY